MFRFLFLSVCLILGISANAQDIPADSIARDTTELRQVEVEETPADTLTIETLDHSPGRASLFSAAVPGLGQAYNKSYWKIPLVYGTLFTFGYFIYDANEKYQFIRRNLIAETDGDPETINYTGRDAENLTSNRDRLRRSRDFNMIMFTIIYLLNIADAHIDAHLIDFEVNPEINAVLEPSIITSPNQTYALGLSFKLKM